MATARRAVAALSVAAFVCASGSGSLEAPARRRVDGGDGGVLVGVAGADAAFVGAASAEPAAAGALAYPFRRVWRLDARTTLAARGLAGDARLVARYARDRCRAHRRTFGSSPPPSRLAADLGAKFAAARCGAAPRPLHCDVVLASSGPPPAVFAVTSDGRVVRRNAVVVGASDDAAKRATDDLAAALDAGPVDADAARALCRAALETAAEASRGTRRP